MDTEADQLLRIIPAIQPIKPSLISSDSEGQSNRESASEEGEDDQLQRALAESRQLLEQDDTALQKALRDSMAGKMTPSPPPQSDISVAQQYSVRS